MAPLTEEQKAQRKIDQQIWRDEQEWRAEQRRIDRERQQAEAIASANREAAIVAQQAREKANREIRERLAHEARERDMASLRIKVAQGEGWRIGVENAARNAVAQQYRQTLMGELDALINLPQPPEPEPQTVVVSDEGSPDLGSHDFDPKAWMKKPRSWF